MSTRHPPYQKTSRAWATLTLAVKRFTEIDGTLSAAAFAYYAFFSLFPLIILMVTVASVFIDRDRAGAEVIASVEAYVPISVEMQNTIFDTIAGVIASRGQAGVIAFLILVWSAMRFFNTLICAADRAWGADAHNWWRLSSKSLFFLAIMVCAVLLGIAMPVLVKMAKDWISPENDFHPWVYALGGYVIPLLVVFLSLILFYRLAPRRPIRFSQVWIAALCATALLHAAENLFVIYLQRFAKLNAVYGAFGGIMALVLWIYLCGCIFIFGACLCAAQAEVRLASLKPVGSR
ncbi:MAG: YihY/virulence factor BrkB family protein [Verrucomicrobiales bacterium]